ncbi:MAG: pyridoxal phosphate-dependent aminotransferase [Clostridia bacterium]
MVISKKAQTISRSQTLAISATAKQMKENGISVIAFTAGEPDCDTPKYIVDAAKKALDEGKTKYTPSSGTNSLRKAIASKLEKENGLKYDFKQIIVSNGAKHSLYNALYAIINDGDEVIIPAPYWLTYPELVKMCGGVPVIVDTDEKHGFKMTAAQLEKAITPKTKAVIINSPSNPSGAVYSKDELYSLAKVIEKTEIIVISDEIYEKMTYDGVEQISIATYSEKIKNQTIVVNGLSKTYAMTGWRVGYLACNAEIADVIDRVQSHMTSNPNSIAQEASLVALTRTDDVERIVKIYDERRKYFVERINAIDGLKAFTPQGSFYLFVKVSDVYGKKYKGEVINSSLEFCAKLLDGGVSCIPGSPFGNDEYIRLSFAVSMDDIIEGSNRIEKFVKSLD